MSQPAEIPAHLIPGDGASAPVEESSVPASLIPGATEPEEEKGPVSESDLAPPVAPLATEEAAAEEAQPATPPEPQFDWEAEFRKLHGLTEQPAAPTPPAQARTYSEADFEAEIARRMLAVQQRPAPQSYPPQRGPAPQPGAPAQDFSPQAIHNRASDAARLAMGYDMPNAEQYPEHHAQWVGAYRAEKSRIERDAAREQQEAAYRQQSLPQIEMTYRTHARVLAGEYRTAKDAPAFTERLGEAVFNAMVERGRQLNHDELANLARQERTRLHEASLRQKLELLRSDPELARDYVRRELARRATEKRPVLAGGARTATSAAIHQPTNRKRPSLDDPDGWNQRWRDLRDAEVH